MLSQLLDFVSDVDCPTTYCERRPADESAQGARSRPIKVECTHMVLASEITTPLGGGSVVGSWTAVRRCIDIWQTCEHLWSCSAQLFGSEDTY
jgi:hypothetical protein